MLGRRLLVRTRPEPSPGEPLQNWTLFARLSRQTARALLHDVDSSDFIPLCVFVDGVDDPIYVSYNGGSIMEDDCIELAAGTVPDNVMHVVVTPFFSIQDAVTVTVEPLTVRDWESLEVYAEVLEDGGLLQQVTIVYPNQILALRVNSEMVRVRVHTDGPCRLLAETEVHVRPKPRVSECKQTPLLRVVPSWEDCSTAMRNLEPQSKTARIHVAPCTVLVNRKILEESSIQDGSIIAIHKDGTLKPGRQVAVARVQPSNLVAENSVVMHKLIRYQLDVSPLFDCIRLETIDPSDSLLVLEMVANGTSYMSLQRVNKIDYAADDECSWFYPHDLPSQPLWHDSSTFKCETSYLTQLNSIIVSWSNLSDDEKESPLSAGSLIALPWQSSNGQVGQQIFQLVVHLKMEEAEGDENANAVCILAKDLPCLLLKSSSGPSHYPATSGAIVETTLLVSRRERLWNLLPPTADLTTEASREVWSDLANGLECFDSNIFTGESGSGKTHAALTFAARARRDSGYATLYVDCKRLQSSSNVRMNDMLQALTDIIREARAAGRCLVILDDIDDLIPNINLEAGEDAGSAHQQQPNPIAADQAKLLSDHLQNLLNYTVPTSPNKCQEKVFVVLTCRDEQSINPATVCQRFYRSISVPSFNSIEREQLFSRMLQNLLKEEVASAEDDRLLHDFGNRTEGFRPRDLYVVATRVYHRLQRAQSTVEKICFANTFNDVLSGYTPISRQGVHAEDVHSSVTWSQVGGLFRVKEHLSLTILRPVKYRRIYQNAPIRLPRGILLFGPTGCGKSYIVPALAKECGLTLITCRGPEVLDRYIGASEAKVRQLFERAYSAAPSLLFLDEFDALAPVRGSDNTGVTDRVVNQLLTYLDGVEDASMGSVYIVAATSRPDKVDPALLRPGRLEQHIYVDFPVSKEEWHSVLAQALAAHGINDDLWRELHNKRLWEIQGTAHIRSFAPSDIKAVVDTAYLKAIHEVLAKRDSGEDQSQDIVVTIQLHHMVEALKKTKPSLSIEDRRMLNHVYHPFISATDRLDEDGSSPVIEARRLRTSLK